MVWIFDPKFDLGWLPDLINENDPRPASEQIDANYAHGGGWSPIPGFELLNEQGDLAYPGDPPMRPVAVTVLRHEVICVYPHAFVGIFQSDGGFEVSRVD